MRVLAIAFVAIVAATSAQASFCSEPSAPSCVTRYGSFDDEDDYDRCKRQLNSYRSEVESYLSCLKDASDDAIREYNDAVQSFNRRAKG